MANKDNYRTGFFSTLRNVAVGAALYVLASCNANEPNQASSVEASENPRADAAVVIPETKEDSVTRYEETNPTIEAVVEDNTPQVSGPVLTLEPGQNNVLFGGADKGHKGEGGAVDDPETVIGPSGDIEGRVSGAFRVYAGAKSDDGNTKVKGGAFFKLNYYPAGEGPGIGFSVKNVTINQERDRNLDDITTNETKVSLGTFYRVTFTDAVYADVGLKVSGTNVEFNGRNAPDNVRDLSAGGYFKLTGHNIAGSGVTLKGIVQYSQSVTGEYMDEGEGAGFERSGVLVGFKAQKGDYYAVLDLRQVEHDYEGRVNIRTQQIGGGIGVEHLGPIDELQLGVGHTETRYNTRREEDTVFNITMYKEFAKDTALKIEVTVDTDGDMGGMATIQRKF